MIRQLGKNILKNARLAKVCRMLNNPFANREYTLIHCCHHRVGTVWFLRIMSSLSRHYFLPLVQRERVDREPQLPQAACIYLDTHSLLDVSQLANFKGTHIIRDPRDLVVSGYHYHLWTDEEWANTKIKKLIEDFPMLKERLALLPLETMMDVSYKEYLKSLPETEGLIAEIKRASRGPIQVMGNWNYHHPDFLEIKYEDLIANEEETFRSIFRHYGFKPKAVDKATQIALSYSFKKVAGRDLGSVAQKSHLRSGKSQQWKEAFGQSHKELFKELHGMDLIKMGYENNLDW